MDALLLIAAGFLLFKSDKSPSLTVGQNLVSVPTGNNDLLERANQKRAKDWRPYLIQQGASPAEADGLTRWIGIESGGNPLAISPLGERGLLQIMPTTRPGVITDSEWAAMISPNTTRDEQARIALKQYRYHARRSRQFVANPTDDPESVLFYAKQHHTRPVDMREGKVHGPSRSMARDLQLRWNKQPNHLRRLAHSTVVAFNQVSV